MKFIVSRVSGAKYDDQGNELPPIEEATLQELDRWDVRTFKTPEEYNDNQLRLVREYGNRVSRERALSLHRPKFWLDEGTDHCTWQDGDKSGIRRKMGVVKEWAIDIEPSGLIKLVEKYGDLIIYQAKSYTGLPPRISIYDDIL